MTIVQTYSLLAPIGPFAGMAAHFIGSSPQTKQDLDRLKLKMTFPLVAALPASASIAIELIQRAVPESHALTTSPPHP
jgi:hypothetical protein